MKIKKKMVNLIKKTKEAQQLNTMYDSITDLGLEVIVSPCWSSG